jgi:hypothetical protein
MGIEPKYTKWAQNIPTGHKIYEMVQKQTKWWPQSIPKGPKMYQMTVNNSSGHKIYQIHKEENV